MLKMLSNPSLLVGVVIMLQFYECTAQRPEVMLNPLFTGAVRDEGTTIEVCFILDQTPTASDFEVTISNFTPDLAPFTEMLTFPQNEDPVMQQCINEVSIVVDDIYESTENLVTAFRLTIMYNGTEETDVPLGTLLIRDNSVLSTQFEQATYAIAEGDSVSVCALLEGSVAERPDLPPPGLIVTADVTLTDVTTIPGDYLTSGLDIDFTSNSMRQCILVTAQNDRSNEETESITLTLVPSSNNEIGAIGVATVNILDTDADCGPPPSGMDVSFTVSPENSVTNSDGILVTNNGATATYTCDDPAATLVGSATLVCDGGLEEWNGMAPECESPVVTTEAPTTEAPTTEAPTTEAPTTEAPTTEAPVTTQAPTTEPREITEQPGGTIIVVPPPTPDVEEGGLSSEDRRNIGLGVGIGVGVPLLLFVLIVIIAVCVVRHKRGQRHSKYVLNYNTVYAAENRKTKPPLSSEYQVPPTTTTAADTAGTGQPELEEGVTVAAV